MTGTSVRIYTPICLFLGCYQINHILLNIAPKKLQQIFGDFWLLKNVDRVFYINSIWSPGARTKLCGQQSSRRFLGPCRPTAFPISAFLYCTCKGYNVVRSLPVTKSESDPDQKF